MKSKRTLAFIAILFLIAMYVITIIAAATSSPGADAFFRGAIFCTIVIPVVIYAVLLIMKHTRERRDERDQDTDTDDKNDYEK